MAGGKPVAAPSVGTRAWSKGRNLIGLAVAGTVASAAALSWPAWLWLADAGAL